MKTSARLENFPIMMFTIVMGMSGLTIAYQKAAHILHFTNTIPYGMAIITSLVFVAISVTYFLKLIFYPQDVKKEYQHPVRVNFFATISISLLLIAILYEDINMTASAYFWYAGMVIQCFLTFYTISFWINHSIEINHSTPAWFIPIVGNVLVPIGGTEFVNQNFLIYFFAIGIFFWVILLTIILNRIIFHNQMASKFMPTLFIFIAPPAIGMISYVKLTGHFDLFASFLFNIGLFFTFLLIFMYKNFMHLQFFISWWAFTFPLTAMTIASFLAYKETGATFTYYLGIGLLSASTIIVIFVAYKTIYHMLKKEICIME